MNNRRPSRPILVLMAGLPGAGKTTLSTALGHATGWVVLHKDEIKDAFLHQGMENKKASWHAYEMSFKHIHNTLVEQQVSMILDTSAAHPFVLERSMQLAYAAHACLKVILCYVSEDVRSQRLGERPDRTGPLKIDILSAEDKYLLFQHLPKDTLHINTEHPLKTCVDIAQHHLYDCKVINC